MARIKDKLPASGRIILELAGRDFQIRYLGSHLGILWAFVQPAANILVLWFVMQKVFRLTPVENVPFVLWLMAGMIPWHYFNDSINNATHSILGNSHLVKKVVFRVETLPVVKILSGTVIHLFLLAVLLLMLVAYGYPPDLYTLQVAYYLFASFALLLGLAWFTSSLIVFLRDIGHAVGLFMSLLFWVTPIFWSPQSLPSRFRLVLSLNPLSYIIEGYRETFIYKVWFWEHASRSLYFWTVTGAILVVGGLVFRKLRPHFADVL